MARTGKIIVIIIGMVCAVSLFCVQWLVDSPSKIEAGILTLSVIIAGVVKLLH